MANETRVVLDQEGLDKLLRSPAGDIGKAVLTGVVMVESAAKRLAPVDTGRLRASITHEVAIDAVGLVGQVGTDVEYAPHVEYGTIHMAPRAFLRGGLAALKGLPGVR